jgi:protein SCO1/2
MKRAIIAGLLGTVVALMAVGVVFVARRDAPSAGSTDLERLGRYGTVPAFALTERSGRRVTLSELHGFVWVADFIFTECTETCPTQSLQFAAVQREFARAADLRLVSITVDPAHDTPEILRAYAERYGATDRWWFLTGSPRAIVCLAREGFRLGAVGPRSADPPDCGSLSWLPPAAAWASHGAAGSVAHSARAALVDRSGQIRAYHLTTDPDSMARLRANLRRLLAEPPGGGR